MVTTLPRFPEHQGHSKTQPLQSFEVGCPEPFVEQFIRDATRSKPKARILDVGCGRGDRVAWLLSNGFDAYGSDISERYIACGSPFLAENGFGTDRLRTIEGADQPFDFPFDVILSDQVIEHIANIDHFARSLAAVSHYGTRGLHVFPGIVASSRAAHEDPTCSLVAQGSA